MAGEADQGEIRSVEHDLQREEDDQRATPDEHSECSDREQQGRDGEIPGDVGAVHQASRPLPRTTPPTAAASRTIEVISKATRWSVRNTVPISLGLPKDASMSALSSRRPPAVRTIATTLATRMAPAAKTEAVR